MARAKLGDVARESRETIKSGKIGLPIVGLEHLTPGEITLTQWDEGTDNTFTKAFHKGQILFGRRRAYLKKAAVAPFDGICSGDITVIEAIPDRLSAKLLPFIIQNDNFFDFAMEKSAGSLSPRAKWEHLQHFEINLPSINKQGKLAELLWAMNDTREAYKKLLVLTDEMIKARFIEMFGDPVTNPMRWEVEPLEEHLRVVGGYAFNSDGFIKEGIPILRIGNINTGIFSSNNLVFWQYDEKLDRYLLRPGDIIISLTGTVGKDDYANICILGYDFENYYLNQRNAKLELNSTINKHYLINILRIPEIKARLTGISRGVRQANVSNRDILTLALPIPPLALQNRFANFVQQADKSKLELKRTLDELESVYKSLLCEIFG